jgi:hypothetical protein
MKSQRLVWLVLALYLQGCESAPPFRNEAIARALVGQWVYDRSEPDCQRTSYDAFRTDGTMTSTDESCDIISDGFGIFDYGWYVADGHVCFVDVEEQRTDSVKRPAHYREKFHELVKRGFVEESCIWKVVRMTPATISIVPRNPESPPFTMKRESWL